MHETWLHTHMSSLLVALLQACVLQTWAFRCILFHTIPFRKGRNKHGIITIPFGVYSWQEATPILTRCHWERNPPLGVLHTWRSSFPGSAPGSTFYTLLPLHESHTCNARPLKSASVLVACTFAAARPGELAGHSRSEPGCCSDTRWLAVTMPREDGTVHKHIPPDPN